MYLKAVRPTLSTVAKLKTRFRQAALRAKLRAAPFRRGKPRPTEVPAKSRIRPVTMISVNELEEILPYVSESLFSWSELLDFRFSGPTGGAFSVHQAIYDLLREKGLSARRNQAIRKSFDEVWKIIGSRYKAPKP
jgi:hypothetical protein